MDNFFFHPKLVHLPIALGVLMPLIAGGISIAWWKGWFQKRVWFIALALQGILVLSAFTAMQSGEAEEERVEHIVGERFIEAHEEMAEAFTWAAAFTFLVGLGAAFARPTSIALALAGATTLGTIAVFGLAYQTGQAGGHLVYTHGAASPSTRAATPDQEAPRSFWGLGEENEDEDEDD